MNFNQIHQISINIDRSLPIAVCSQCLAIFYHIQQTFYLNFSMYKYKIDRRRQTVWDWKHNLFNTSQMTETRHSSSSHHMLTSPYHCIVSTNRPRYFQRRLNISKELILNNIWMVSHSFFCVFSKNLFWLQEKRWNNLSDTILINLVDRHGKNHGI